MTTYKNLSLSLFTLTISLMVQQAQAQFPDWSKIELETVKVTDNIHTLIAPASGNITLFHGDDGVFMIDSKFAPLADKIRAATADVTGSEVRYLINTHWHPDHVGGNEAFGQDGAIIVAHDQTRINMGKTVTGGGKTFPPSPEIAKPIITFSENMSLHLNGEEVDIFHVPPSHSDDCSFIYFTGSNVLALGDVFLTDSYAIMDHRVEASIHGYIDALQTAIDIADDDTKVIPGHGPVTNRDKIIEVRNMYIDIRGKIQTRIDQGKSLDAVLADNLTAPYDKDYTPTGMFGHPKDFIASIYNELKGAH